MRRLYALLLPALAIAVAVDLWLRLYTPAQPAQARFDNQAETALSLQQLTSLPLPPLFDLFYTEAISARQNAATDKNPTDVEPLAEPAPAIYRLLALRIDPDGSKRAIISLQTDAQGTPEIFTLLPGEDLGGARLLTIESRAVLLKSPTGETRRLFLFEPAAQGSPDTDN